MVQDLEDRLDKSNGKRLLNHFSPSCSSMILLSILVMAMNSVVDSKCLITHYEK
jgi:hypothetical protein